MKFIIQTIMLSTFVVLIAICQIAIETKRFLLRREEKRADQVSSKIQYQKDGLFGINTNRLRLPK